MTVYILICHAC